MKLDVNKKGIKNKSNLILKRTMITGLVAVSIASAIYFDDKLDNAYNMEISYDDGIALKYVYNVKFDDGRSVQDTYTSSDLKHIEELTICITDGVDYSFINDLVSLKRLNILDKNFNPELINSIDFNKFNNLDISIYSDSEVIDFNEARYGFLKGIKSINNLIIGNMSSTISVDSKFLESLKNVHNLTLGINSITNYNYSDLSHLDSLNLSGLPYDVAMYFSKNDLDILTRKGVKITTTNFEMLNDVLVKIDDTVKSLNIDDDMSDVEKLNILLGHIMDRCEYDSNIKEHEEKNDDVNVWCAKFYSNGRMTGIFESDTQICGNYASYLNALCHSVGIESYYITSDTHAWNIVKIDGNYYYVDSTMLDKEHRILTSVSVDDNIRYEQNYVEMSADKVFDTQNQGYINQLEWYLVDPTDVYDNTHKPKHIPTDVILDSISDQEEVTNNIDFISNLYSNPNKNI